MSNIPGFLIGVGITLIMIMAIPNICTRASEVLKECERTLPRDQHCMLTAVPERNVKDSATM